MTNEEARVELVQLANHFNIYGVVREALDMAIEALTELDNNSTKVDNKNVDFINRQDAIDEIEMLLEQAEDDEHDKIWNDAIRGAINAVKHHTKSAQPEIIRCKDCKYCDRGIDEDGIPFLKCLGWSYGGTHEDDFCSHAERRTDEIN